MAKIKILLYFLYTKFISVRRYTLRNSIIICTFTFFSLCFFPSMPIARRNLRSAVQMCYKAWHYFFISLITHIFHFKCILVARIPAKLFCKPSVIYTYCTKIHILTQLLAARDFPLCIFFKYLSSFILLEFFPKYSRFQKHE